MHICRNSPTPSSTDAKALDVGGSRAALALVLRFRSPSNFYPITSMISIQ
jgi:hypothetical protein